LMLLSNYFAVICKYIILRDLALVIQSLQKYRKQLR